MPGKQSKARYKAMLTEVDAEAYKAFRSGSTSNPYPVDDKRHERFNRRLNSIHAAEWLLEG